MEDLLKKYTNEAIKFALLQTNYRNDINIVDGIFEEAEKHLTGFYKIIKQTEEKFGKGHAANGEIGKRFDGVMSDDFNTALVLSDLFAYFKEISKKLAAGDKTCADDVRAIRENYSLLGLFKMDADAYLAEVKEKNPEDIPESVKEFAEKRWQAKLAKNWAEADALRAQIDAAGYTVKDSKDGYAINKK